MEVTHREGQSARPCGGRGVRVMANPEPKELGFWATGYLMSGGFPGLVDHADGQATAYTVN